MNTSKDLFIGSAFVTINDQTHMEDIVEKFEMNIFRRFFNFFWYSCLRCKSKMDDRYLKERRIKVERAAEPPDILWGNLGYTPGQRFCRSMVTFFITGILLIIAFGINFGLNTFKQFIEDQTRKNDNPSEGVLWVVRITSIITSFFVVAINVILRWIIRRLSLKEKPATYTKYHLSVASKVTIAMFTNTALIPILVNFGKGNWFNNSGLVVDIFFNTLSVGFVSPFFYLFNIPHCIKRFRRCKERCKGEYSKMT